MNEQLFTGGVSRLKKWINTSLCFYLNILHWLSLLHFHQLVSFVEDRNTAVIIFFKGGSSQVSQLKVLCGYLATAYVAIILQSRKSLEILSSHSLRLLVDSELFCFYFWLSSFRQRRNIVSRPKIFFDRPTFPYQFPKIIGNILF